MNIEKFTTEELLKDKAESLKDIDICQRGLEIGLNTYSGGEKVKDRLKINQKIVEKIDKELERRKDCLF